MCQVNRVLKVFCLFYAVAIPAYVGAAGPGQAEAGGSSACGVSLDASASSDRRGAGRAKKACKNKKVFNLAVTLEGAGSGRVSSAPAGIYCQIDCSEDFAKNTTILLDAQPYTGSVFTGWSGACSGTGACSIKLKTDATVSANFMRIETPPLSLVTPYVNQADMREINDYFNAQYDDLPWGRIHDGLDIDPNDNLRPYQSVCAGRVKEIYVFDAQVTLVIDCDTTYSVDYNFETQAPNTGQIQLDNILVTEGQLVAQGEVIGYLYSAENPDRAHVHFTLYQDAVPVCPEPFFTPAARESILNLVAIRHTDVIMCRSGNVLPPPLATPYYDESDFDGIKAGFSSEYSISPWEYPHDGLDIYPVGDQKRLQAACSGKVDALELQLQGASGNWQVEVAIVCDDYVWDPDTGGYFIPLTTKYFLRTMSADPLVGQAQLDNIMVALGDPVSQGDNIGYLKAVNPDAHLHFELQQFGQSEFHAFGVTGIPLCPQAQFSSAARASVLNLLQAAWPGAEICYP
jgi:hypothetical protein